MTTDIKTYVAGFLFDHNQSQVLLIKKAKPSWQKDKFNAIGGKIEPNELPMDAMHREFEEETGINRTYDWNFFCELHGNDYTYNEKGISGRFIVYFYKAFTSFNYDVIQAVHSSVNKYALEPIAIHDIRQIERPEYLPNLSWLIPLALKEDSYFNVIEREEE